MKRNLFGSLAVLLFLTFQPGFAAGDCASGDAETLEKIKELIQRDDAGAGVLRMQTRLTTLKLALMVRKNKSTHLEDYVKAETARIEAVDKGKIREELVKFYSEHYRWEDEAKKEKQIDAVKGKLEDPNYRWISTRIRNEELSAFIFAHREAIKESEFTENDQAAAWMMQFLHASASLTKVGSTENNWSQISVKINAINGGTGTGPSMNDAQITREIENLEAVISADTNGIIAEFQKLMKNPLCKTTCVGCALGNRTNAIAPEIEKESKKIIKAIQVEGSKDSDKTKTQKTNHEVVQKKTTPPQLKGTTVSVKERARTKGLLPCGIKYSPKQLSNSSSYMAGYRERRQEMLTWITTDPRLQFLNKIMDFPPQPFQFHKLSPPNFVMAPKKTHKNPGKVSKDAMAQIEANFQPDLKRIKENIRAAYRAKPECEVRITNQAKASGLGSEDYYNKNWRIIADTLLSRARGTAAEKPKTICAELLGKDLKDYSEYYDLMLGMVSEEKCISTEDWVGKNPPAY